MATLEVVDESVGARDLSLLPAVDPARDPPPLEVVHVDEGVRGVSLDGDGEQRVAQRSHAVLGSGYGSERLKARQYRVTRIRLTTSF